jgi:hypothetical protein
MKIYLTILLAMFLVFACDSSDPETNETKCTSNTDCTDSIKTSCNADGECVAETVNLFINEIMASNASYLDDLGNASDWIEIYNPNNSDIDLAGYYLCDNHYDTDGITSCTQIPKTDSTKTTVKSYGFIVFYFDGIIENGVLHVSQKLGGSGDKVYLISPDETIIDSKEYLDTDDLSTDDTSFGRSTDGGNEWILFTKGQEKQPTPNETNEQINTTPVCTTDDTTNCSGNKLKCLVDTDDNMQNKCVECLVGTDCDSGTCQEDNTCKSLIAQTLFINEIMASNTSYTDFPDSDWVEIYNDGDTEVDLSEYYLCDDHYSSTDHDGTIGTCTQIPVINSLQNVVPAKGHIVFYFDKDGAGGVLNIVQNLGGSGDTVTLINRDGGVVDTKTYLDTDGLDVDNTSFGRSTDGGDTWVLFGDSLELAPTPMAINGSVSNIAVCTEADASACTGETTMCLVDTENALNNSCVECLVDEDCTDGTCNDNNVCDANPEVKLFINEIMASNTSYTNFMDSDWVEIYNDSDIAVDLGGYYLCDENYDTDGITECTQIPDTDSVSTTVASKGFLVFYFNKDDLGGVLNVAQKLGGSADTVTLIDSNEVVVDSKYYIVTDDLSTDDTSLGRTTDGGNVWETFEKGTTKEPTPGSTNVQ